MLFGPESSQLDSAEFDHPGSGRSPPDSSDFGLEARRTSALINAWTEGMTRKLISVNEIFDWSSRWGRLGGLETEVGLEYPRLLANSSKQT